MGYESKIYVVKKSDFGLDVKRYAQAIAMVDMCKCYAISDVLRRNPETDCYFYDLDGNTQILEDAYGKPLTEAPIREVIKLVEKAMSKDGYWRYEILLATLKGFEKYASDPDFVVLHYGY